MRDADIQYDPKTQTLTIRVNVEGLAAWEAAKIVRKGLKENLIRAGMPRDYVIAYDPNTRQLVMQAVHKGI